MKLIFFTLLITLSSYVFCQIPDENNPLSHPNNLNKWFVDSLDNRPIEFYLNHPKIDYYSKLFYKGEFAVSDDKLTFALLDSLLTNNNETRCFYKFIFNNILKISDGALSEALGSPCRHYFELQTCEFIDLKFNELFSDNYQRWIDCVAFEYYFEDNPQKTIDDKINALIPGIAIYCPKIYVEELENIRKSLIKFIKENEN